MSKQTRRSISISGATYNLVKKNCEKRGISMSTLTEALILEHINPDERSLSSKSAIPVVVISMNEIERSLLTVLKGNRKAVTLKDIEAADGISYLQAKNAVRRPRTLGLVNSPKPGTFELTAKGKKVTAQMK